MRQDVRFSFLQELIPEMVSVERALEAQKQHGIVNATPAPSSAITPTKDSDLRDHFVSGTERSRDSHESMTASVHQGHVGMLDILNPMDGMDCDDISANF